VPDSGGPGKYRGGVCHEYAFTPNRAHGPLGLVLFGKGTRAPMSLGLFGGYPGCNVAYSTFRHANVAELPASFDELRGESREDQFWGMLELEEGDAQYVRFMGGGGYGDPIDRGPALVEEDVERGLVSAEAARAVYGVVPGSLEQTRARRLEIRTERLGRAPETDERREVAPSGMRISEYLQRSAGGATQCTWCGLEIAAEGRDWKDGAVLRRVPLDRAGPLRTVSDEFSLIESCCPGCGTLLDTELAAGDDPPLHDRIVRWPE
jgi:N-methylhydantoinase B